MTRKIKGLGLAFVAVAAMSMVGAGSAQAVQVHVNHNGNVSFFGAQDAPPEGQHVFTTAAGTVKCEIATFEATVANQSAQATADELTATPTYTGCQAFGQAANIDMNGCKYTITSKNAQTGITFGSGTANVDVVCKSGAPPTVPDGVNGTDKPIEITTAICRMTVPAQNDIAHIIFSQSGTQAKANVTATGITYQADGPLCPNMPTGQQLKNGTYVGQATFQAREDPGTVLAEHNGHKYQKLLATGTVKSIQVT